MRATSFLPPLLLPSLLLVLIVAIYSPIQSAEAFSIIHPATKTKICHILLRAAETESDDGSDNAPAKKKKGDSLRDATGIRPSLNPTAINCIAEALLLRSQFLLGKTKDGLEIAIDTANTQTEPIQIAITAAGIAMAAIDQRNDAAKTDETTDIFSTEESQTISGRVVGVVMRMRELEQLLVGRVNGVKWVRKYGEEESFGVFKGECQLVDKADIEQSSDDSEGLEKKLAENIKLNPLFRMNRAECLLALFLSTVEQPKLDIMGEGVSGGSEVDFIDSDRLEVLLLEPKNALQ